MKELLEKILRAKDLEFVFEQELRAIVDAGNREKGIEGHDLPTTNLFKVPENLGNAILFWAGVTIDEILEDPDEIKYYEDIITTVYRHNQDITERAEKILEIVGDKETKDPSSLLNAALNEMIAFQEYDIYDEYTDKDKYNTVLEAIRDCVK